MGGSQGQQNPQFIGYWGWPSWQTKRAGAAPQPPGSSRSRALFHAFIKRVQAAETRRVVVGQRRPACSAAEPQIQAPWVAVRRPRTSRRSWRSAPGRLKHRPPLRVAPPQGWACSRSRDQQAMPLLSPPRAGPSHHRPLLLPPLRRLELVARPRSPPFPTLPPCAPLPMGRSATWASHCWAHG